MNQQLTFVITFVKLTCMSIAVLTAVTGTGPTCADQPSQTPSDVRSGDEPCGNLTQMGQGTYIYNSMPYAWVATFVTDSYFRPVLTRANAGAVKFFSDGTWHDVGTGNRLTRRTYTIPVPPMMNVPIIYCADRANGTAVIDGGVQLSPLEPDDEGPGRQRFVRFTGFDAAPKFKLRKALPYFRFNRNSVDTLEEDGSIVICADADCRTMLQATEGK